MHEARVLHVLAKASRDVYRIRTYETDVHRVETGWKQPIYIYILPPERSNNSLSFFSRIIRWRSQIGMPIGPESLEESLEGSDWDALGPERGPQPKNPIIY